MCSDRSLSSMFLSRALSCSMIGLLGWSLDFPPAPPSAASAGAICPPPEPPRRLFLSPLPPAPPLLVEIMPGSCCCCSWCCCCGCCCDCMNCCCCCMSCCGCCGLTAAASLSLLRDFILLASPPGAPGAPPPRPPLARSGWGPGGRAWRSLGSKPLSWSSASSAKAALPPACSDIGCDELLIGPGAAVCAPTAAPPIGACKAIII
mmetsp:Transcript_69061/g.124511  ORF Transcript_69061/g.124511 Transcript_69061/m.124511 type:complete len:205 (+) Transcript_69061:1129-1743(+)